MRGVAAQYTKEKKMGPTSQVLLYRDLSRQVIELRDRFSAFMRSFNGDEDDTFDSSFEFSHFDEYFIAWIETDLRVNLDDNLDLSPTWSYHHATLAPFVLIMAYSEYRTDPDRYQYWKLAPGSTRRTHTRVDLPLVEPFVKNDQTSSEATRLDGARIEILLHRLWRS